MYIKRTLEDVVLSTSKGFAAVLINGPRQVGKTTLFKNCDKSGRKYVTLDRLSDRNMAKTDPEMFLQRYAPPVLIDEVQYAPELFPYIKIIADETQKKGLFWLTGSQQFSLMSNVSESLAGRVGILNLHGLSQNEKLGIDRKDFFIPTKEYIEKNFAMSHQFDLMSLYEMIWNGSFPALNSDQEVEWESFYASYLQTYIERDIRDIIKISDESVFLRFMQILASRTGQLLNYSDIAKSLGVSQPTVKSWVSLLQTSGLIYLLQPYYNNISNRAIKTPKMYFLDTGLCCYLTGWANAEVLEKGAMSGAIFETYVVAEILKSYWFRGKRAPLYFYRDKEQKEIDLLIDMNGKLHPVEIKKATNPDKSAIKAFEVLDEKIRGEGAVMCLAATHIPLSKDVNIMPVGYI